MKKQTNLITNKRMGFSYIELMIVLAVFATLLLIIAPSFGGLVEKQKARSVATLFYKDIKFARQMAAGSKERVIICATEDGVTCVSSSNSGTQLWTSGRIIFLDENNDGDVSFSEMLLVRYGDSFISDAIIETSSANLKARMSYDSDGRSSSAVGSGKLTIKSQSGAPKWEIIINTIGNPRLESKS